LSSGVRYAAALPVDEGPPRRGPWELLVERARHVLLPPIHDRWSWARACSCLLV
jgi:hypothetical protein